MIRAFLLGASFWSALILIAVGQIGPAVIFGMIAVVFFAWLLEG